MISLLIFLTIEFLSEQTSPQVEQSSNASVQDISDAQSAADHQETSTGSYSHEQMDTSNQSVEESQQFLTADNQSAETDTSLEMPECDPVDIAVVNRCLQEPVLCRDASDTLVPSLLREVYQSANPEDSVEALSVLLHVLMLETGYVMRTQVFKRRLVYVVGFLPF